MKKVLSVLLTAVLAMSLTACGGSKDAKTIYDDATKKTSELTSMDVKSVVNMQMTQEENTTDISMDMDMKIADINTDSMKYLAQGTTSVLGQTVDISMYYEDGYYYMDSMGQKIKYAMDLDAIMEQVKQSTEGGNLQSSYLKDLSVKTEGDTEVLTYTVDAEKMDDYVQELMGQMGTDIEGVTYLIKEASGEATVNKDGYFENSKVKLTMDMSMQGESITIVMDTDSTYNNPGQAVEVTAPDLEGYTEVDPSTLQTQ